MTDDAPASARKTKRRGRVLGWLLAVPGVAWGGVALGFVQPILAVAWLLIVGVLAWSAVRLGWSPFVVLAPVALVAVGWFVTPPRNDRDWDPEGAETAWGNVDGDRVTLHNFRAFDWRTETDFTPRWTTRTFRLSQLRQLDFIMTYWGSPHICHTMVTFDFGPDGRVCASIEARRERGEAYSAIGGMFRRHELIYVLGDERDLIRLRTAIRPGNDVYLFRLNATPAVTRALFLDYIATANALREEPAWYHSLLTNCSTTIRAHVRRAEIADPWDWRVLANGHADERLYDFGYITRDLPLAELKRRSRINIVAREADAAPDFSERIRVGLPGFAKEKASD